MKAEITKAEITPEFLVEGDRQTVAEIVPVRDAATLIVIDRDAMPSRALTGVRKRSLAFMPGLTVFPGGAVDKADGGIRIASDFSTETKRRVTLRTSGLSESHARAFGLAAIRETYEETGLMLGIKGRASPAQHESWQAFYDNSLIPSLENLYLVARAITPPYRPRRFDTRFFTTDTTAIAHKTWPSASDLEDIAWLTLEEITAQPLAFITRQILKDIAPLFETPADNAVKTFPFYYAEGNKYYRELLP